MCTVHPGAEPQQTDYLWADIYMQTMLRSVASIGAKVVWRLFIAGAGALSSHWADQLIWHHVLSQPGASLKWNLNAISCMPPVCNTIATRTRRSHILGRLIVETEILHRYCWQPAAIQYVKVAWRTKALSCVCVLYTVYRPSIGQDEFVAAVVVVALTRGPPLPLNCFHLKVAHYSIFNASKHSGFV